MHQLLIGAASDAGKVRDALGHCVAARLRDPAGMLIGRRDGFEKTVGIP